MNSIISVNRKFMELTPKELVELILNSKYTKGLEICIDNASKEEEKYLDDLVFELKKHNLILQVHGNSELPLDKQLEYLRKLEKYSDYLNQKIAITLHSLYNDDKEKSLKETAIYMSEIINNIDNNKLVICLENLNDIPHYDRLEKEYIRPVVLNDENLYFTYDIGHEIADFGNITNLDNYMIEDIRNVHIHTNVAGKEDHQPIYKNDPHWDRILKGLEFLKVNKYKYNIVYEYDLYACHGDNVKEKVIDYLNSIDFVSERY